MDDQLSPLLHDNDDASEPSRAGQLDDARERSLAEDLRQLIDDGRALAEAELAYRKSCAALAGKGAKGIAIFGALAAALVFFALMALTVGLVIALTPLLTALGAAGARMRRAVAGGPALRPYRLGTLAAHG